MERSVKSGETFVQSLETLLGRIFERPHTRRFRDWVPVSHVEDDPVAEMVNGEPLKVGESYLSLRVAEMRL